MSDPLSSLSDEQLQTLLQNSAAQQSATQAATAARAQSAAIDPSAGGGRLQIWNPVGNNIDLGVNTPQWLDRTLAGAGQGMVDVTRKVGNLLGGIGGTSNSDLDSAKQLDAPLLNTTAGKVGNLIGTTAITAPLMGGVTAGALRAAPALAGAGVNIPTLGALAKIAGNPIGRGVLEGATQGLVTADPGERLSNMLAGGAIGGAIPTATALGGKVISGLKRTPEAQALINRGVDLTPGLLNPESQRNATEESFQSLPFVGAAIRRARLNAGQGYQQAIVREAAAPGATIPNGNIHDMLTAAYNSFQPLYDQAKGFPVGAKIVTDTAKDIPLSQAFESITNQPRIGLTANARTDIAQELQDQLNEVVAKARRSGGMDSGDLIQFRSILRAAKRGESLEDNASRARAAIYGNAADRVTQALESQLPQDATDALRAADSKYGAYTTIEDAVARAKDRSTGLSPTNLSEAVKAATPERVYAQGGGGPLRDLAQEGKQVFDVRSPPTGARMGEVGIKGGFALEHPLIALPLALAKLPLITTAPGRAFAAGNLPAQRALSSALSAATASQNPLLRYGIPTAGRYLRGAAGARLLANQPSE